MRLVRKISLIYSSREENSNKFYVLDLIENDGEFELLVRYGRLGKNPVVKKTSYRSLHLALSEFEKKYAEKVRKGYKECEFEDILASDGSFANNYYNY